MTLVLAGGPEDVEDGMDSPGIPPSIGLAFLAVPGAAVLSFLAPPSESTARKRKQ